jgi:hypothetical protein
MMTSLSALILEVYYRYLPLYKIEEEVGPAAPAHSAEEPAAKAEKPAAKGAEKAGAKPAEKKASGKK